MGAPETDRAQGGVMRAVSIDVQSGRLALAVAAAGVVIQVTDGESRVRVSLQERAPHAAPHPWRDHCIALYGRWREERVSGALIRSLPPGSVQGDDYPRTGLRLELSPNAYGYEFTVRSERGPLIESRSGLHTAADAAREAYRWLLGQHPDPTSYRGTDGRCGMPLSFHCDLKDLIELDVDLGGHSAVKVVAHVLRAIEAKGAAAEGDDRFIGQIGQSVEKLGAQIAEGDALDAVVHGGSGVGLGCGKAGCRRAAGGVMGEVPIAADEARIDHYWAMKDAAIPAALRGNDADYTSDTYPRAGCQVRVMPRAGGYQVEVLAPHGPVVDGIGILWSPEAAAGQVLRWLQGKRWDPRATQKSRCSTDQTEYSRTAGSGCRPGTDHS